MSRGLLGEPGRLGGDGRLVHGGAHVECLLANLFPDFTRRQERIERRRQGLEDRSGLGALLPQFDLLPLRDDRVRRPEFGAIAEDVRVTAHHLLIHLPGDIIKGEFSGLGGHLRMHDHVEEQIAELLA